MKTDSHQYVKRKRGKKYKGDIWYIQNTVVSNIKHVKFLDLSFQFSTAVILLSYSDILTVLSDLSQFMSSVGVKLTSGQSEFQTENNWNYELTVCVCVFLYLLHSEDILPYLSSQCHTAFQV